MSHSTPSESSITATSVRPTHLTLLDIGIDPLTRAQTVDRLLQLAATGRGAVALYANAHVLNLARRDATLRAQLHAADVVLADGQSVVWAARWSGQPLPERVSVGDIEEAFFTRAHQQGRRLFLIGGRPGVAERAAERLGKRWPGFVVGTHHGYFALDEETALAQTITERQPDIVIVGMGSPKQESWALRQRDVRPVRLLWCAGAAIERWAGDEPPTPQWLQRSGGEWLYRLCRHPRRFWRRYLVGLPLFAGRAVVWGWRMRRGHRTIRP